MIESQRLMKTIRFLLAVLALSLNAASAAWAGVLADVPLALKGGVPPNVLFALSVEYPTANTAAYQGINDYSATAEYLGYFDPDKCYSYDSGNGWFYPTGPAESHRCANWSGNFLNWATMTGLDEFRYAMTGGNRVQDTASLTVLERSYQSGQGGVSNFPDKTFVEDGHTTPYPSNTRLTIKNQGLGTRMAIYPNGSGVATCARPSLNGTVFSCTSLTLSDGTAGSCNTWSGNGTQNSPYACSTFGAFGGLTPSSATIASVGSGTTSTPSLTVNCTNPQFYSGSFLCDLSLSNNGHSGSCRTWSGSGSSDSPYICSLFDSFSGGETFNPGGGTNSIQTFATVKQGDQISETIGCTFSGNDKVTSCALANGDTFTCKSYKKLSTGVQACSINSWSVNGAETLVSTNPGSTTTTLDRTLYYTSYQFTYRLPVTATSYYVSSYPGSSTNGYYYAASYNLAFGSNQNYNVRVKVCDPNVGQESNCKQFGSSWKPTGAVQDNGDKIRFGVMSYFQANDVDNAVLRSKLKYVAPQRYSPSGASVVNANTEWSAIDGTLIANPDATDSATANSFVGTASNTGVINYVNKFGNQAHTYKTFDNVGKLYYEALRYLRGMPPTSDFYNGATANNADGFPVINSWDDPVQYSCQKNYIVVMGDTHTWCDKRLPGGSFASSLDARCDAYTDVNGHSHSADSGSLSADAGINVAALTNSVGSLEGMSNLAGSATGTGNASYYMAGLAKWAASSDVRANLPGPQHVETIMIDVQEYQDCGYQSQFWLAGKYGKPASYDSSGSWLRSNNPAMLTTSPGRCNSRQPSLNPDGSVLWPKNLLSAGDPLSMISSVKSALATIVAQIGDEASLSQSSGALNTGTGAYIYRALYNSSGWQGEVQALPIDTGGNAATQPAWQASTMLPSASSRSIFTYNDGLMPDGTAESTANSRRGVAFDPNAFSTNLSSLQQALLNKNEFGVTDNLGVDRMNWLRGDQSKEALAAGTSNPNPNPNNGWRSRTGLLGDIVDSQPVFVAGPAALPGAGYSDFVATYANRKPMIYVGSNDGMLHAFDASYTFGDNGMPVATQTSGRELFAYVPSAIYANLGKLMSPNYSHKFFVDATPTVGEAHFSSGWKTMLVGGLGAGGQGMYALDVTDPEQFSASKVLWEFTDKDDSDLGYTFSKPIIRKLNNGRWAVIFGSGYNNTVADGNASTTGQAYLYILYVEGPGAGHAWRPGTDYFKIALSAPGVTGVLNPANGLSSPSAIDRDGNGTIDIVYAGDRLGNLWKVDLSADSPSGWGVAFVSNRAPQPLFTARSSGGSPQQITTGIDVAKHPLGGFMVIFGTGSWVDQSDPFGPFNGDSVYGIWDKDDGTMVSGRSSLQRERVITYVDSTGASCTQGTPGCYVVMSNCRPNYTDAAVTNTASALCPDDIIASNDTVRQMGWVFDLPGNGERMRSEMPRIDGNTVIFKTLTPATDPCSGNTRGDEYTLSYLYGTAPSKPVYVFSGNPTGLVSTTINGVTVTVVLVGTTNPGGASGNSVFFRASPQSDVGSDVPPGTPTGYIPGWGYSSNMSAAGRRSQAIFCDPPEIGAGGVNCIQRYQPALYGRLGWKQITH